MKYLRSFEKRADYKQEKKRHTLQLPNVSYIIYDGKTYITPAFATKYNAEAGDILVYTKESYDEWSAITEEGTTKNAAFQKMFNSITFIKPEAYTVDMAKVYVPEAIVAVPYSHTDDNTIRVMSLKNMNPSTPATGGARYNVCWGDNLDISDIKNYSGCVALASPSLGDSSGLASTTEAQLPSDAFTALEVVGSDADYYWYSANNFHAPCPYKSDGSLNPQFRGVSSNGDALTTNCLADMDGYANTKAILNTLDKKYLDTTLMADSITNEATQTVGTVSTSIFPAAMCCQRYSSVLKPNTVKITTTGAGSNMTNEITSFGDWYLPSAGEIAYAIVSRNKISYALSMIRGSYNTNAADAHSTFPLWSSSEKDSNYAWYSSSANGGVSCNINKGNFAIVRAFASF